MVLFLMFLTTDKHNINRSLQLTSFKSMTKSAIGCIGVL